LKYVILIGDGMADRPCRALGGLTPLAAAPTPNLDFMARNGRLGLAKTVPDGMPPSSDVAILSLLGYHPKGLITGRGPLEAASQNLDFGPGDLVFRLNLINVEETGGALLMRDHAADNISTQEARELLAALAEELPLTAGQRLHPGVSYRHILIWPDPAPDQAPSHAPHDYRDRDLTPFLNDPAAAETAALVRASRPILEKHPVNAKRRAAGRQTANCIWLWGQGRRPVLKTFQERWGLTGAAVSAVDLIKGLGILTGLETPAVPGATGWVDTNYKGKVEAALEALTRLDLAVVHLEAPDETSHRGELDLKMRALTDFDSQVAGPLLEALPDFGDFRILAASDHPTPLELTTHTADPVPFLIYSRPPTNEPSGRPFSEAEASATGLLVSPGADLGLLLFGPEK
jgi:2,3-bisphosphoglycerate-independent phosphoglycerate mutase